MAEQWERVEIGLRRIDAIYEGRQGDSTEAEVIPTATLVVLPGHGHLSIIREIRQLAGDFAAALR